MYDFTLNFIKSLHEDHMATLALLERLEAFLGRHNASNPPAADSAEMITLMTDLAALMEAEIGAHFSFEEEFLFPRFADFADAGIPMMLKGEHDVIRPIAERMTEMARGFRGGELTSDSWAEFHRLGLEIIEREVFHVQKEEMGFLPALDQMLDPDDEAELAMAYAEKKGG